MIVNHNSGSGGGGSYTLPVATETKLGGVKIGTGITIDAAGRISVTGGTSELQPATSEVLGGVKIGSGVNVDTAGTISVNSYTLPAASSEVLGGVKIGEGISIDSAGTISVSGVSAEEKYFVVDALSAVTSPQEGDIAYVKEQANYVVNSGWTWDMGTPWSGYANAEPIEEEGEDPIYFYPCNAGIAQFIDQGDYYMNLTVSSNWCDNDEAIGVEPLVFTYQIDDVSGEGFDGEPFWYVGTGWTLCGYPGHQFMAKGIPSGSSAYLSIYPVNQEQFSTLTIAEGETGGTPFMWSLDGDGAEYYAMASATTFTEQSGDATPAAMYYYDGTQWQEIENILDIPAASQNTLGLVKVGSGLTIDSGGTLSVSGGSSSGPAVYVLNNMTQQERAALYTELLPYCDAQGYAISSGFPVDSYQFYYYANIGDSMRGMIQMYPVLYHPSDYGGAIFFTGVAGERNGGTDIRKQRYVITYDGQVDEGGWVLRDVYPNPVNFSWVGDITYSASTGEFYRGEDLINPSGNTDSFGSSNDVDSIIDNGFNLDGGAPGRILSPQYKIFIVSGGTTYKYTRPTIVGVDDSITVDDNSYSRRYSFIYTKEDGSRFIVRMYLNGNNMMTGIEYQAL